MAEDYVGFYVQDIEFRSAVVPAQTPLNMCLSSALAGYVPISPDSNFSYCDICCGDGTTLNALASLNRDSLFYGIDFNPLHIKKARETAQKLGLSNVTYIEASIADVNPEDFPMFDFITINGAYSWLDESIKQKVLAFVSSRLKDRGLFYVEYMALPGRVAISPLWKLIQMLVPPDKFTSSKERGKRGLYLLRLLARRGMFFLQANPPAARAAQFYLTQSKTDEYYIDHFVHNALASGFRPMFFYEMYEDIKKHGLSYIGSVDPSLNDLDTSVPPSQIPTFFEITEPEMVETVKDFIRNTMDRRDLFSKNPTPSLPQAIEFLKEKVKIFPSIPITELRRVLNIIGGHKLPLKGPIFDKFFSLLEQGRDFITLDMLSEFPEKQLLKALIKILATNEYTVSFSEPDKFDENYISRKLSLNEQMNAILLEEAVASFWGTVLISTATKGAAVHLSPVDAIILKTLIEKGKTNLTDLVAEGLSKIEKPVQTQTGMKNVNTLRREEIDQFIEVFLRRRLPLLFKLKILKAE